MSTPPLNAAKRLAALRPSAVNRLRVKVEAARARGADPVLLLRGEPDFATPAHIVEAAERSLRDGETQYPPNQGLPELRQAIAEKMASRNGLDPAPAPDDVLVTTGATEGLFTALQALLNPGDEVLLVEPVYDVYHSAIALCGGVPVGVPAERDGDRLVYPRERLAAAVSPRTRALLLNNPWNPTGTVMRRDELDFIASLAMEHDLILIADEIYEEIVYEPAAHLSLASLGPEVCERTITLNSLSKTYAMTGWRLGYIVAPPAWTQAMYLALQQWSRGPATFIQHAGIAALSGPQDCVAEMRAEYQRRRQQVLGVQFRAAALRWLPPEGGFFALLDVSDLGRRSDEVADELLHVEEVVVMPGSAYGEAGEGLLRVSFAVSPAALEPGLGRLQAGLQRLSQRSG